MMCTWICSHPVRWSPVRLAVLSCVTHWLRKAGHRVRLQGPAPRPPLVLPVARRRNSNLRKNAMQQVVEGRLIHLSFEWNVFTLLLNLTVDSGNHINIISLSNLLFHDHEFWISFHLAWIYMNVLFLQNLELLWPGRPWECWGRWRCRSRCGQQ